MPGHIRKRGQSSWTVIVDLGNDPTSGKRRQLWRSVKGPKREAEALLVQLLHERDTGVEQPRGKLTVATFLDRWLDDFVEPNLAPKTCSAYREVIQVHLVPALGSIDLVALRPSHIQSMYSRLLKSGRRDGRGGLSKRSVLRYHQILHAALRQAVHWQFLVRNPADAVEPPRPARRELQATTPAQARAIMAAADQTSIGPFVRLALLTGARRGELLGLRWADVDLESGPSASSRRRSGSPARASSSGSRRRACLGAPSPCRPKPSPCYVATDGDRPSGVCSLVPRIAIATSSSPRGSGRRSSRETSAGHG